MTYRSIRLFLCLGILYKIRYLMAQIGDSNYSFFPGCSQDELSDVIDIKDPDFTSAAERRQKRLAAELAKFDPDHYL